VFIDERLAAELGLTILEHNGSIFSPSATPSLWTTIDGQEDGLSIEILTGGLTLSPINLESIGEVRHLPAEDGVDRWFATDGSKSAMFVFEPGFQVATFGLVSSDELLRIYQSLVAVDEAEFHDFAPDNGLLHGGSRRVQELLDIGAEPNEVETYWEEGTEYDRTPLEIASQLGCDVTIELLTEAGATR
jgi:hypothetical protein